MKIYETYKTDSEIIMDLSLAIKEIVAILDCAKPDFESTTNNLINASTILFGGIYYKTNDEIVNIITVKIVDDFSVSLLQYPTLYDYEDDQYEDDLITQINRNSKLLYYWYKNNYGFQYPINHKKINKILENIHPGLKINLRGRRKLNAN